MGKVEKFVVLGVLSLIVVILVVSQNSGAVNAANEGDDNTARAQEPQTQWPFPTDSGSFQEPDDDPLEGPTGGTVASADLDQDAAPSTSGLLIAGGSTEAESVQAPDGPVEIQPVAGPVGDLIVTTHLTRGLDPALRYYVCRSGDTFEALAERYYGDAGYACILRQYNEGRQPVRNLELTLPVDLGGATASVIHVVQENESLWKIAAKHYGAGHRWEEIRDANRDVLPNPDALTQGMELIIP